MRNVSRSALIVCVVFVCVVNHLADGVADVQVTGTVCHPSSEDEVTRGNGDLIRETLDDATETPVELYCPMQRTAFGTYDDGTFSVYVHDDDAESGDSISCTGSIYDRDDGSVGDDGTDSSKNGDDTLTIVLSTSLGADATFAVTCDLPNDGTNEIYAIKLRH